MNDQGQLGNGTISTTSPGTTEFIGGPYFSASQPTTTTITSDLPDPSVWGQPYTVTVSVTAASGTPTGTVTVQDDVANSCAITLSGGTGSCNLPSNAVGSRTLSAVYAGASGFDPSTTSLATSHTVQRANTTTTITAHTPDPSLVGFPVAVSVKVVAAAPGVGLPTGSVLVTADGASPETCTVTALNAAGEGSCNLTFTATGARGLAASYVGDSHFFASASSGVAHQVNLGSTTTTIASVSANPSTYGDSIDISGSVAGGIDPAGTVTVTAAPGGVSCVATLSSGAYGCSLTPGNAGGYTLTAVYSGDGNDAGSSSTGTPHTVDKASATITFGSLTQTYTGSPLFATWTTAPVSGLTVDVTYGGGSPPTNVGSYALAGTINDTNYQGTQTGIFTIDKAIGTATFAQTQFVYSGSAHPIVVTINGEAATCTLSDASVTLPGAYEVSATACSSANHTAPGISATVIVAGATIEGGASFASLQNAIDAAVDGDIVEVAPATYAGGLVIPRGGITVKGPSIPHAQLADVGPVINAAGPVTPAVIIDGGSAAGDGITVLASAEDVTIDGLWVRNFGGRCVFANAGTNGFTLQNSKLSQCGDDGFEMDVGGSVDSVTIHGNEVTAIGLSPSFQSRGIVLWDDVKTNITITDNYVHDFADCCGIELQEGTASGVTITGNRVENVGDSGMGLTGLGGSSDPGVIAGNVIANNVIENTGRFGIEIKLPNGTGALTGNGSIIVSGNTVSRTGPIGDLRDSAGIAVFRRAWQAGNADIPTGVIVTGNTVSGYRQSSSPSEGFGIVVEGTQHRVHGNTLHDNDVGLQLQAGHLPYAANTGTDGDQSNLSDQYFGRGNSPVVCADVGSNDFSGTPSNGTHERSVGPVNDYVAVNASTGRFYCTIQSAIDDPLTLAGHVIEVNDGITVAEQVTVGKGVRITSQSGSTNPATIVAPETLDGGAEALFRVVAPDVTIDNLQFDVDLSKLGSAIVALNTGSNNFSGLAVRYNAITGSGTATASFGKRHAISLNGRGFAQSDANALAGIVIEHNDIGVSGPLLGVAAGTSFASGIEFDDASATPTVTGPFGSSATPVLRVANNRIAASHQDANLRYNFGRVVVTANTFRGAGLEAGEAQGLFEVTGNTFQPLTVTLRSLGIKSVQHGNAWVHVAGNTFKDHAIGVAVQNSQRWHLLNNDFQAPAGDFIHLSINTRPLGGLPGAFASLHADVQGNTFAGSASGRAVVFGDHDYRAARGTGMLDFGSAMPNAFTGPFAYYFWLDPSDCPSTHSASGCAAPFGNAYASFYPAISPAPSVMKPFPVDVAASNNTFDGKLPSAMNLAEVTTLHARTYHDDPLVTETAPGAAPAALGKVDFGLANVIPTSITITSVAPLHAQVGDDVMVTFNVVTDPPYSGVPNGTITVSGTSDGVSCVITVVDNSTTNSCTIAGGFTTPGVKSITATFAGAGAAADSAASPVPYTVFSSGPTPTVTITPAGGAATAVDNDYTRINNAVQAAVGGVEIVLDGTFDWTEMHAAASWKAGSNGVIGNNDDWSIQLPIGTNFRDITIRAATPLSATIVAGGDMAKAATGAGIAQTSFLRANDPNVGMPPNHQYHGVTIQDLVLDGFDQPIQFNNAGSVHTDRYNGLLISGVHFVFAPDAGENACQRAIRVGYGKDMVISDNVIQFALGTSVDPTSCYVGISTSSGGSSDLYDGLSIRGNAITASGAPVAPAPLVVGIWENGEDSNSAVSITDNLFAGSGNPSDNNQVGIIASTHSNGARQSMVRGNTVSGASVGLTGQLAIYGHYVNAPDPQIVEGNTFLDNAVAIQVRPGRADGSAQPASTIRFNRVASALPGSAIGIQRQAAVGGEKTSIVTVDDNWWGCNDGPAGGSGCSTQAGLAGGQPATWLKLSIAASPTSFEAGTGSSAVTTQLVRNTDNTVPTGLSTTFPSATYGYTTSLGSVSPTSHDNAGGSSTTTLTSATAGGALVTITLDNGQASTYVLVTDASGPPSTVTLTPATSPTALDNDYTRINNAVQAAASGTTIVLDGAFDWTETNALASWASNNYEIPAPANLDGVTITGIRSDSGTPGLIDDDVYGTTVTADTSTIALNRPVRFIRALNGGYRNWTIKDLRLIGFERPISMVSWQDGDAPYPGSPVDAMEGLSITGNRIDMSSARVLGTSSNMAISYGPGNNIRLNANHVVIAGNREHATGRSTYGFMNYTTGGSSYDGLQINDNLIQVGAPAATGVPERVVAIWENTANSNLSYPMQIVGNRIVQSPAFTNGAMKHRRVAVMPNHASSNLLVSGNEVSGWGYGFSYMHTDIVSFAMSAGDGTGAVLSGNTFTGNQIAMRNVGDNVTLTASFNRVVDGVGIANEATSGSPTPLVDDNWWGCNGGPAGGSGCATQAGLAGGQPATWLKLSIAASPTSFEAGSGSSAITTQLVRNTDNTVPTGLSTTFPSATYGYTTSLGAAAPSNPTATGGTVSTTLTSATAGGALVTTTLDNGSASTSVLVTDAGGPPNTATVTPATSPTALDNDYTRINNAVQAAASGTTIILAGQFDWSPHGARDPASSADPSSHAYQSWVNGTTGVTATAWSIVPPRGLAGVTITAAAKGGAGVVGGATIRGPGDVASANLEGVFSLSGGTYHGWTISNLELSGFDLAIGMHHSSGGPVDAFKDFAVLDNIIRVPADGVDANQNIGLHFAFGKHQRIAGNEFHLDVGGTTVVGMQSETSGNDLYDGLRIEDNTIRVVGMPSVVPATVIGIWENNQGFTVPASIEVSGNRFINETGTTAPAGVTWRAFQLTSQSVGTKLTAYRNNHVDGASVAFTTITGSYTFTPGAGSLPTLIEGNTIINSGTAIRAVAASGYTARIEARYNRIDGSGVGVLSTNAVVDASNNWWGCNAGPDQTGCSTSSTSGAGTLTTAPWLQLSIASDTPIVGAGGSALLTASVNGNSSGNHVGGTTKFPAGTSIAFASSTSATFATPDASTGSTTGEIGNARNTLGNIFTTTTASATLDNETVSTPINVNQVSLHANLPASGIVNVQSAPFPVTINNNGAALSESTSVFFNVSRVGGLTPGQLAFEYEFPVGTWNPVAFTAVDADTISASLPVGNLATPSLVVNLRATSTVTGTLDVFATLVGNSSHALYSSDGGSVDVVDAADLVISIVSGSPQTAPIGSSYAVPVVVRVADGNDNAIAGVPVVFSAPGSGATVTFTSPSGVSDAQGAVSSGPIASGAIAGIVIATASIDVASCTTPNCDVDIDLTNTATAPTSIVISPTTATAVVNTVGAYALTATVTDAGGNPVPGVSVSFAAPGSGASTTPAAASVLTSASGQATVTFDANSIAGSFSVVASTATSGSPITATTSLTNTVGAFDHLTLVSGSGQTAPVNAAFAAPLVVRAEDADGNPVVATVTFAAPPSGAGATLGSLSVTTGPDGLASTSATANATAGNYVVSATSGASSLAFNLTNTATAPAAVTLAISGTATANVGNAFAASLCATVTDASSNPLSGISVTFAAPGSGAGATFVPNPALTNAAGIACATPTANATAGTYAVTALVAGAPASNPVTLTNTDPATAISFDANALSQVYNGSPRPVIVTTTPAGLSYTLSYTGSGATSYGPSSTAPTAAGSYAVVATISSPGYSGSTSGTLTIAKAVSAVTFSGATSVVYTGSAQTPLSAVLSQESGNAGACSIVYTPDAAPINVGTYTATATCDGTNYTGSASTTLVITPASLTVTLSNLDQVYTGTTRDVTVSTAPTTGIATTLSYVGSGSTVYGPSATAPINVGSYLVSANVSNPNYSGSATATLVVGDSAAVALTTTGPEMALVTPATSPYADHAEYTGTLANTGGTTSQKVHYRISVVRIDDGNSIGGNPPAIDADDVEVCLFDPSGWAAQHPSNHRNCPQDYQSLFISRAMGSLNGRSAVTFRYPNLAANDIQLPNLGPSPIVAPSTLFQFKRGEYRVQVDVVGSDSGLVYATATDTTSVPEATVQYSGATSGPTEQALLSTTTLANTGGRVVGNVIVRVTLSDALAAPLAASDVDFAYLDGSTFATLPWTVSGGSLVTYFGPPGTGFELADGHDASTTGRGIFHRIGDYNLLYEVVDIATGAVVHASEQKALNIGPNNVTFTLGDLNQVYDTTPRPIAVSPAGIPHQVIYEPKTGSCPVAAGGSNTTPPTDAGSYCVYVSATGTYSGAASGTLVVAKAAASVSIDGAVSGTVTRSFDGTPQIVTATATPAVASVALTYNGSPTAPSAAGSYSLLATIVDPNHEGSTTGTLVINIAGGATITLDEVVGGVISRDYTGSAVAPVTATTTPTISYVVTYTGSGGTVYPQTTTPPTAVGSYAVVATTADANYSPVSASGTLVVGNASAATLSFSATPDNLPVAATTTTSATLSNAGGPIGENVLVRYTITRDVPGLAPAHVALRYDAGGLQPLGLSQVGNSLVGFFGPQPGGFPVAGGYSATTAGDAVFQVAGVYSVTLDLVGVTTSTIYATTSDSVTVTQGSGAISIDASTLNATYDAQPHPVTVTTTPAGLAYTVSYLGSGATTYGPTATAPTNAGTYAVTATLNDPNYSGSVTQTLTIAKAVSPVTFSGATSVVYTGSAQTPLSAVLSQEPGNAGACAIVYTPDAAPTHVGTYTATATCDGTNHTGSASTTLTITPNSSVTVTLFNLSQTYDGSPKPVTVVTSPFGLTTSVTYNGSGTVPTDAGTYTVVATITQAGYSGSASATLVITKATAGIVVGGLSHVYDGFAKSASATTTPSGVPVTFTYNGNASPPVNAGSYTVVATANGPNHAGSATATLVIAKATVTVILSDLSQTYDGTPRAATAVTSPVAGLAVSLSYDGNTVPPLAVGSYAVVASVVDANYQGGASGTLVIGKATASVVLGDLSRTFTGSPISASATTTPAGLAVQLSYDGNPSPPTAVGSYAVVATIGDASYQGTASATLVIGKATASVGIGSLSQVYTGGPKTVSVTTTPAGLPHTVTYDGNASPPSAVGSYAVVVTVNDPSYVGTASATLVITKAAAVVTLGDLSQIHDGTPRVVSVTTAPSGLSVALTYDGSPTAPTSIGTYAVVATVNDATYQGSASGTLVVTNGNATVTLSNLAQTYDGSPKPVTVTTSPSGLTTSVTFNGSSTVPTAAGSYTVVATITSPGYSGSGAATLVIGKATATVTLGNLAQTYDGTPRVVSASTTPSGLTVDLSYAGSPIAPTSAGTYAVTGTIVDANYQGGASASLVVAKATATINLAGLSQTYDGTPRVVTATTAPVSGLAASISYDGSVVAPVNAGSYPIVATVNDPNHQGSTAATLTVAKATATVSVTNLSQSFDGSPKPVTVTTTPAGLPVTITYDGGATVPSAVGSYAVLATVNSPNHQGTGTGTLVIGDGSAAITLGGLSHVYDGSPKLATATTNPTGLSVSITYDGGPTAPTSAGSYAVVATITSAGYTGTASGTLTIAKANATVTLGSLNPTYDGSPKPATATTTPSGLTVTFTYDGSPTAPTNAGTYLVVGTIGDGNHTGSATGTLTIAKASATVTLAGLTQAYNGSPRPVIVTTTPSGLATSVTYNGSPTAPTSVGTYAVSATVTNPNYTGSAVGTLQVTSGSAGTIAASGATSFSGTVGQPLAGGLPAVLVTDAGGNPVANIPVTFVAGAGSGSVSGAVQNTGANGVATLGGWVLGPTAPTQTVTATAAGVSGSVIFTATTSGTITLTVNVDSGRNYVRAGQSISHLVTIGNNGSLPSTGTTLTSTLPPELDAASLSWICIAGSGSSCGSSTSGAGNLPTAINVGAGSTVSFLLSGTVLPGPTDVLTYAVSATRPAGTTGSNGSGSDTTRVVIFRDGFEQGGDGAQWPEGDGVLAAGSLDGDRVAVVDVDPAVLAAGRVSTLVHGAGGSFRVDATWADGKPWLRLVSRIDDVESGSEWFALAGEHARFALSLDRVNDAGASILLVSGNVAIDLPVAAGAAATFLATTGGTRH